MPFLNSGLTTGKLTHGGILNSGLISVNSIPNTWDLTVVTTSASQSYTINIFNGSGINIIVDWGDGNSNTYTTTGAKNHTYASAGTYIARLSGSFSANGNIRLGTDATNRDRLKAVGVMPYIIGMTVASNMLSNCTGLTDYPADLLRYNPQITTVNGLFYGCTNIAKPLKAGLLRYCINVIDIGYLISLSGITSIDNDVFRYCPLITNASYFASGTTSLNWSSVPADIFRYNQICTNFAGCFNAVTLPTSVYSNLLISLNAYNNNTGVQFHGGFSKYNASGKTARDNLTGVKGWTITDGGLE